MVRASRRSSPAVGPSGQPSSCPRAALRPFAEWYQSGRCGLPTRNTPYAPYRSARPSARGGVPCRARIWMRPRPVCADPERLEHLGKAGRRRATARIGCRKRSVGFPPPNGWMPARSACKILKSFMSSLHGSGTKSVHGFPRGKRQGGARTAHPVADKARQAPRCGRCEILNGRQAVHEDLAYNHDVGEDCRDALRGEAAVALERQRSPRTCGESLWTVARLPSPLHRKQEVTGQCRALRARAESFTRSALSAGMRADRQRSMTRSTPVLSASLLAS